MDQHRQASNVVLFLILAVFAGLAGAYSVTVPLLEAPDETSHVDFVRFLRTEKRLPRQGESAEAHQPPLYYALAALASAPASLANLGNVQRLNPAFVWTGNGQDVNVIYHTAAEVFPWHGPALAIHLMRGLSVLLGLATVIVVYLTGRELWPERPGLALAAAAIAALTPQFLFMSGVVNNDNLANLCAAIAIWMMIRLLLGGHDRGTLAGLGLSLGAGLLAKQSILVLVPVAALVLVYAGLRQRNWRFLIEGGAIVGAMLVLLTGWWYGRNVALYGDPFGINAFVAYRPEEGVAAITDWPTMQAFLTKMHGSFWGTFGWMNLSLPPGIYRALAGGYVLAALGAGIGWLRSLRERPSFPWSVWILLLSLPVLYLLWVVLYGYRFGGSGWQGRYLFPALPAVALLLTAGLAGLVRRGQAIPPAIGGLALLALSIWALPGVVKPAYQRVTQPLSRLDAIQQPMDVNLGNLVRLAGYDLSVAPGSPEPKIEITFYWQALGQPPADYTVFVHFVNLDWDLYGQGDGPPVAGHFPTSAWRPGDLVVDSHLIELHKPIVPGEYRIGMGWYLADTGERLSLIRDGQEVGTVAETAPFALQP